MINICPGKLYRFLTTPHELFYGIKHDASSWFPIFSISYVHYKKYGAVTMSDMQSQTQVRITIG